MTLRRLTPAVSRSARLTIAGLVWTVVGIMLVCWAAGWLAHASRAWAAVAGLVGVGAGLFAWRTMFSRLASDNAARIRRSSVRACVFAFTAPKGWLVTVVMVGLGAALRHSSIPKAWLAVPYAAIGTALFLASLTYYTRRSPGSEGVAA